jgi:hypothetical protein
MSTPVLALLIGLVLFPVLAFRTLLRRSQIAAEKEMVHVTIEGHTGRQLILRSYLAPGRR